MSNEDKYIDMHVGGYSESYYFMADTLTDETDNHYSYSTPTQLVTMDTLYGVGILHKIDFLKIDIEGSELEVIYSTDENLLSKCEQICLEFHLFCSGEYDFTYNEESIKNIIKKLSNIGFKNEKTNNKHPDYRFYK